MIITEWYITFQHRMCSVLELWNDKVLNCPSWRCSSDFVLPSCHFFNANTQLPELHCMPPWSLIWDRTLEIINVVWLCPVGKKRRRSASRQEEERERLQGEDVMTEGYKAGVDGRSEMEKSGRRAAGRLVKTWHSQSVCTIVSDAEPEFSSALWGNVLFTLKSPAKR